MQPQPNHASHHFFRRGALYIAPLFIFSALLLSGCVANITETAGLGVDVVKALVDIAAADGELAPISQAQATTEIAPSAIAPEGDAAAPAASVGVVNIPLAAPLNTPQAEISGMTWYGDRLILLPQYPGRFGDNLFALDKAEIGAYLRGERTAPLSPTPIAFDDGALFALVDGFEGFEAISFAGDRAYLTIEARSPFGMSGLLVSGQMAPDGTRLVLNPFAQASIPAQASLSNMADEAITRLEDMLITFYEANGANVNPNAQAHLFTSELESLGTVALPTLEYRLTDATEVDGDGRFWVINYMWPGDAEKLRPAADPLSGGQSASESVERLVELQFTPDGITLTDTPPISLRLLPGGISRNWEGIARFQADELDGFLLVTDEFPATMLGFVPR